MADDHQARVNADVVEEQDRERPVTGRINRDLSGAGRGGAAQETTSPVYCQPLFCPPSGSDSTTLNGIVSQITGRRGCLTPLSSAAALSRPSQTESHPPAGSTTSL